MQAVLTLTLRSFESGYHKQNLADKLEFVLAQLPAPTVHAIVNDADGWYGSTEARQRLVLACDAKGERLDSLIQHVEQIEGVHVSAAYLGGHAQDAVKKLIG